MDIWLCSLAMAARYRFNLDCYEPSPDAPEDRRDMLFTAFDIPKLRIVEIPDGTDYIVGEYDGSEHIAETHRTWL